MYYVEDCKLNSNSFLSVLAFSCRWRKNVERRLKKYWSVLRRRAATWELWCLTRSQLWANQSRRRPRSCCWRRCWRSPLHALAGLPRQWAAGVCCSRWTGTLLFFCIKEYGPAVPYLYVHTTEYISYLITVSVMVLLLLYLYSNTMFTV